MQHILILTRPEAKNKDLAFSLQAAICEQQLGNIHVLSLPALTINPYAWSALTTSAQMDFQQLGQFDAVFCVSPLAIDIFFSILAEQSISVPAQLRFLAVGGGSKEALLRHGIAPTRIISATEGNDSEALLQALQEQEPLHRLLLVRGETGRNWLLEQLQQQGIVVHTHTIYQRLPSTLTQEQEHQLLNLSAPVCLQWLFTSSESVRALLMTLHQHGIWKYCQQIAVQQQFWVIHPRIAEVLKEVLAQISPNGEQATGFTIKLIDTENTQIQSTMLKHAHNIG